MKRVDRCKCIASIMVLLFSFDVSAEECSSGHLQELNQELRMEAIGLKEFLETRKRSRLIGRDLVEACSRWSVMSSYAKSMSKQVQESPSMNSAASMVQHLRTDLEGNNECWTSSSPHLASMMEGLRIVISRATRLGRLLPLPFVKRKGVNQEYAAE